MAVKKIVTVGDPVLRRQAQEVPKVSKRIVKLLRDMEETMYAADGVGLAAPQVGVSERLIVVDVGDGPVHLINPEIREVDGNQIEQEGCLSIPGVHGYVERAEKVVISGLDIKGKQQRIEATGWFARALQHEIDHLNGVLFIDKATGVRELEEKEAQTNSDK